MIVKRAFQVHIFCSALVRLAVTNATIELTADEFIGLSDQLNQRTNQLIWTRPLVCLRAVATDCIFHNLLWFMPTLKEPPAWNKKSGFRY